MPKFIVYVNIESPIGSDTEDVVTEVLQQRYFYRRVRPEDYDKPMLLPRWMYEGDSDYDQDTLAHELAVALGAAAGVVLYVMTIPAERFGLWYLPGSMLGIDHLDPDRQP